MKHKIVFHERSKYCKMNQNFITFFSMKKLKNKTEKNTVAAKIKIILKTSQNAASDTSVVADTNMRLAFLKDN